MFENIPKNWKKYKLKDLYYILRGGSPRPIDKYLTSDPNGINWIKIGDAKVGSKFIESTKEKIIPEGKNKSRFVNVGDFILSNSMSFGRPYIMKTEGCIHDGWLVLKEKEKNIIYKDFVYYLLCSKQVHSQFENAAAGGVVSNLNIQRVENVEVVIPNDIREQKEIADVLDAASEIIRLRTACIESAQSLIPALFQEMFGDVKNNTKNWKLCNLNDLVYIDRKNISVNELKSNAYRYIGLEHIEKDTGKILIDLENNFNVDLKSNKYYFTNEHVLYGKLRPYLNKVALPTCDGVCSTDIFPIMPRKNISNKYFIKYLMSSPYFVQITSLKTSGANLPRIGTKVLELIKVICPDIEIQNQFAAKAQEIEAYIKTQQAELENAKTMFQSLLHYAFMGELTKYLQKSN